MQTRVLIGSPIHQKPAILSYFLFSLRSLNKEGLQVEYLFFDDNLERESSELLKAFQQEVEGVEIVQSTDRRLYVRNEETHYWNDDLVDKVAEMKDQLIEHALDRGVDALFLVDSDLMLVPQTLRRLLDAKKDIVSNIFWTKWKPQTPELPQVWVADEYSFSRQHKNGAADSTEAKQRAAQFLAQLRVPGLYEVGGLGACTLISANALQKGVRFRRMHNLSFWGEDRHFCIRAVALGLQLFVDTHLPAFHIYRDSDLGGAELFKQRLTEGKTRKGIEISLCMIVKNEEEVLARCLSSVREAVDEIVIVDTGSTDRTKEIAESFNAAIYDFEWVDDFAAARNFAFSKATKDYILWLDADDYLKDLDRQKLDSLKISLSPEIDSVMMDYHLAFDSNGKPTSSLKRNRLVKRSRQYRWIGAVHEYLEVYGNVIHSDIAVTHKKEKAYTDRNLQIYRRRTANGEKLSPRDLYYFANELKDHAYYEEATEQYEKFLSTRHGWIEDVIAACMKMADCYGAMYERDLQFRSLFRSMEYAVPRAECCCRLGALFLSEERYAEAIYWYERATQLGEPPKSGGMVEHAAWTWLPYLQLCVCYDKLGQYEKAYDCNEKALGFHPSHPSILSNKSYLEKKLAKEETQHGGTRQPDHAVDDRPQ